jgi:serpin B
MNTAKIQIVSLLAISLFGCGSGSTVTPPATGGTVAQSALARDTNPSVSDADLAAIVGGNTDFALKAFPLLDPGGNSNTVFSPYSITQALALAAAGAKGTTLSGIEQALSFPLPQERLNPAFNKLDLLLKAKTSGTVQADVGQTPHLNIVDAVWGQQGFPLLPAYLDTIALNYGAGLRLVDFAGATEESRLTINAWVAEQTNQRIKELLAKDVIKSDTRVVLTNAIWFEANWAEQFEELNTQDKPFFRRDGSSVPVPFMQGAFFLPYMQGNGCRAVDVPYTEGNLSMLVIMPDAGTFDAFVAALTPARLAAVTGSLASRVIDLSLPKFTFDSAPGVGQILATLGMVDAFNPGIADFSGIDGNRDLFVGAVIHKAFISVDEKGTEAAAATAVVIFAGSVRINEPPPLPFVVDHPFLFLIRDRQTGLILFMGKVVTLNK